MYGARRTKGLLTCERCVCETLVEASECVPQSAPRSASSASDAVFVLASFCASSLILPSTTTWIDLEPSADYEVHILQSSFASGAQFEQVRRFRQRPRCDTCNHTPHSHARRPHRCANCTCSRLTALSWDRNESDVLFTLTLYTNTLLTDHSTAAEYL